MGDADKNSVTNVKRSPLPAHPIVGLVPVRSTWTCPNCERQNTYNEGVVSDPQNKCFACGTKVTVSHETPATPRSSRPAQDKGAPERVWITWDDAYPWTTPETGGTEYVRADSRVSTVDSGVSETERQQVVADVVSRFRCFGKETNSSPSNPINQWTKDEPPQFALGVDVREVVDFVISKVVKQ